jgi:hypothetical protein
MKLTSNLFIDWIPRRDEVGTVGEGKSLKTNTRTGTVLGGRSDSESLVRISP